MAHARADRLGRPLQGTVLVVDDQEGMRALLRALLENSYHVAEADSGAALHRALEQAQPDVVLLDLKLPDANGLSLLPAINKRWPGTQVVMLTGAPSGSEALTAALQGASAGAFTVLPKSAEFNIQTVLAAVDQAMERRRHAARSAAAPGSPLAAVKAPELAQE